MIRLIAGSTILLTIASSQAPRQRLSPGIKGGIPLARSELAPSSRTDIDRPRWTVGPTLELDLGRRFALGADALYRHHEYTITGNVGSATFFDHTSAAHWELPCYLKYRFSGR